MRACICVGPGTYGPELVPASGSTVVPATWAAFVSKTERIVVPSSAVPGPGHYKPEDVKKSHLLNKAAIWLPQ